MKPTITMLSLLLAGCVANGSSNPSVGSASSSTLTQVTQDAAAAFVAACVNTATNPNLASRALLSRGFVDRGERNGRRQFESATATAAVSRDTNGLGLGQCTVTPKGGDFSATVLALRAQMATAAIPTTKLPNEEAWLIGATGAIALISRAKGAMTRTQPNVFRGSI